MVVFSACKKEDVNLIFQKIEVPVNESVNNLFVLNDTCIVACGGRDGSGYIIQSKDGGISWDVLKNDFPYTLHSIFFVDAQTGYAGADSANVFFTTDGGLTWSQHIEWQGIPLQYRAPLLNAFFLNRDTGYFVGGKNFDRGIIYYTFDGGSNWQPIGFEHELRCLTATNQGLITVGYGAIFTSLNGYDFELQKCDRSYFTSIAFDNHNRLHGYACSFNGALYETHNGGQSFSLIDRKNKAFRVQQHFLCLATRANMAIACGPNGQVAVKRSADKDFETGISLDRERINAIKFLNDSIALAASGEGHIFRIVF
jgi:photosystem II stability/assembly factor-like uncharacterized protein